MAAGEGPARALLVLLFLGGLAAAAAFESSGGIQHQAHLDAQTGSPLVATAAAAGGGAASAAADEPPVDDSVRCRLSGICDAACNASRGAAEAGGEGAPADDPLACLTSDEERAAAVLDAARHAWGGYRDCAWGQDELQPLSCTGAHWFNLSLTMVDSLDTLYLLGLRSEFEEAATYVAAHLDVGGPSEVNLFETTIRVLGGLLSAQALSAGSHPELSRLLAGKAAELGARLMPAFNSPSGVPFSDVNLRTGAASHPHWGQISSLSEISSVSLEFTYLSRLTGHQPFEQVPLAVHDMLEKHSAGSGGLLGQFFNPVTGKADEGTITLGARSDSYYEYLLKQWLLTGKTEAWLLERYVTAMRSVRSRLLMRTSAAGRPGLWYIAEQLHGGQISGKMDHLVCFLPGLLALGDLHNVSTRQAPVSRSAQPAAAAESPADEQQQPRGQRARRRAGQPQPLDPAAAAGAAAAGVAGLDMPDIQLAAELAQTCYEMYRRTPAGLAPEIAHFAFNSELQDFPNRHVHDVGHGDFSIKPMDAHYLLRPEAVESFFLLWKATGDPRYKDWAWQVFRALEKWARVRPADREELCTECVSQAVHEALKAHAAKQAAAAQQQAAGGGGEQQGEDQRGSEERRRAAAESAAAEALQARLHGVERCRACTRSGGYSSLESVLAVPPQRRDKMESFFLAETLKYLWLAFTEPPDRCLHPSCGAPAAGAQRAAEEEGEEQQQQQQQQPVHGGGGGAARRPRLPLDAFVFTTEAHPLPVVGSAFASRVGQLLDSRDPRLRPFGEQPSGDAAAEAAQQPSGDAVAEAAQQQGQQQGQPQQPVLVSSGATPRELEAALEQKLHQLADAALAAAVQQQQQQQQRPPAGAGARQQAAGTAGAAADEGEEAECEGDDYDDEELADEEEDDPYEPVESDSDSDERGGPGSGRGSAAADPAAAPAHAAASAAESAAEL